MAEKALAADQHGAVNSIAPQGGTALQGNVTIAGVNGAVFSVAGATGTFSASNVAPRGYSSYPKIKNNTVTPDSQIDIGRFSVRDSTNTTTLRSSALITLDISATGLNGRDGGSLQADKWYALFGIGDSTGVNPVRTIASTSFSAPALPVGYNRYRRIGACRTDGSSDLYRFKQIEDLVFYESSEAWGSGFIENFALGALFTGQEFKFHDVGGAAADQVVPSTAVSALVFAQGRGDGGSNGDYLIAYTPGDASGVGTGSGAGIMVQNEGTSGDITAGNLLELGLGLSGSDKVMSFRDFGGASTGILYIYVRGYRDSLR